MNLKNFFTFFTCSLLVCNIATADPAADDNSWWWDDAWWNEGQIEVVENFAVETSSIAYQSGDVEVPALVVRPKAAGKFPAVLFQHGRRGLDELAQRHVRRIAARGFVVLAPDIYTAHFIGTHPIEHDYALEKDVNAAVDVLPFSCSSLHIFFL